MVENILIISHYSANYEPIWLKIKQQVIFLELKKKIQSGVQDSVQDGGSKL